MNAFANAIREARLALRLSIREVARLVDISHEYLGQLERGEQPPVVGRDWLLTLADRLHISRQHLVELAEQVLRERWTDDAIESLALEQRTRVLQLLNRDHFRFPRDIQRIPMLVANLKCIMVDSLIDPRDRAGLFVGGATYQGETDVIVIANDYLKRFQWMTKKDRKVSDRTKWFQVAHELGHNFLHWLPQAEAWTTSKRSAEQPSFCSRGGRDLRERQANNFAGAFMMPREELRQMLSPLNVCRMDTAGREICEHFFVEPWMLKFRLKKLAIRYR